MAQFTSGAARAQHLSGATPHVSYSWFWTGRCR